jgi:hypothetical protein
MSWYLHSQNPEAVLTLYPSKPALKKLRVLRLLLSEEGPALSVEADLEMFPERPPARWHHSFSVAQAKISFWGVRGLSISGWGTMNDCEIHVEKKGEAVTLHLHSGSGDVRTECDFFRIDGIAGYAQSPNQQGGADGRQPSGSDTNRTSAAAASRRSP